MGSPSQELWNVICRMGSQCYLPSDTQVNAPRLNPSQIPQYSIHLPQSDGRQSCYRQLVAYQDGLHARRQSPIKVLTQLSVQ